MKKLIVFLMELLIAASMYAQQSSNSSGGNATGAGGTSSYSIGQLFYTDYSNSGGFVKQGVQLPYEVYVTEITNKFLDIDLKIYPNPTSNKLTLNINNIDYSSLSYQLNDMQGKCIQNQKIESNSTIISIGNLSKGVYFLSIIKNRIEVKTFKIIKN